MPRNKPGGLPSPESIESVLRAAMQALPGAEGGFTIEVRPLAARRGTIEVTKSMKGKRPTRGAADSRARGEAPDEDGLGELDSQGQNWRPNGRAVLSLAEVARALDLSRTTIFRLIRDGQIKAVHAGRRVLVPIGAVEAILASGVSAKA